jgi:hypothetical protein
VYSKRAFAELDGGYNVRGDKHALVEEGWALTSLRVEGDTKEAAQKVTLTYSHVFFD